MLTACQPFPGDGPPVDPSYVKGEHQFLIIRIDHGLLSVYDRVQGFDSSLHPDLLKDPDFVVVRWYAEQCTYNSGLTSPWEVALKWTNDQTQHEISTSIVDVPEGICSTAMPIEFRGVQVDHKKYPSLQCSTGKGQSKNITKANHSKGGCQRMACKSTTQLWIFWKLHLINLSWSTCCQMRTASCSTIPAVSSAGISFKSELSGHSADTISEHQWETHLRCHQHQQLWPNTRNAIDVSAQDVHLVQPSKSSSRQWFCSACEIWNRHQDKAAGILLEEEQIVTVRKELIQYAEPLCKEMHETGLPPLWDINHTIPLIDKKKKYSWRPSKCPEAFHGQGVEKRDAYLKMGRWEVTSAGNTVPMLLIPKPHTSNPVQLWTVVDLQERNKNTQKMISPLPDMEGMLRRTASWPYRMTLDMKNAYEQIRIMPKHVPRSTVTTPDSNMVSNVIQQEDCNGPATHQALMNHIFSTYIGHFMDIYMDDIVIYSNTLNNHVQHVKLVIDILWCEKLYLSHSKLFFVQPILKLLGCVIDDQGIRMDLDKVDSMLNWKVPTNRDMLRGFIGSVGYLVNDIPNVRIPMGILSSITGDAVPFHWLHWAVGLWRSEGSSTQS